MRGVRRSKAPKTARVATSFEWKCRFHRCSATQRIYAAARRDAPRSRCIFRITPNYRTIWPKRSSKELAAKSRFRVSGVFERLWTEEQGRNGEGEIRAQQAACEHWDDRAHRSWQNHVDGRDHQGAEQTQPESAVPRV